MQDVHKGQIRAEDARYEAGRSLQQLATDGKGACVRLLFLAVSMEATVKLAERDVVQSSGSWFAQTAKHVPTCQEVKLRVGRMRDMAKVKFSRRAAGAANCAVGEAVLGSGSSAERGGSEDMPWQAKQATPPRCFQSFSWLQSIPVPFVLIIEVFCCRSRSSTSRRTRRIP